MTGFSFVFGFCRSVENAYLCNMGLFSLTYQETLDNPLLFGRGFADLEHLDAFGLINMNGRMYDPWVGRFLALDPIVQQPGNAQSYNRYSYALNNPLKYTDPSGYALAPILWENRGANATNQSALAWHNQNQGNPFEQAAPIPGWYTYAGGGVYLNSNGEEVSFQEVFDNYIVPNSTDITDEVKSLINDGSDDITIYFGEKNIGVADTKTLQASVSNAVADLNDFYDSFGSLVSSRGYGLSFGGPDGKNEVDNWTIGTWHWIKEHYYIGAEGEITYGFQIAGILYKGIGINADLISDVVSEGKISNKGSYVKNPINKTKVFDFGAAYYIGGNYNQTILGNGTKTHTISLGVFGFFGVTLNFNDNWSFVNGYGGLDISGKAAVIWGASGSLKLGIEFSN